MIIFYIALVIGVITAVAYVSLAAQAFVRVRRRSATPATTLVHDDADYDGQARNFTWKAAGGVIASTLVLVLISVTPLAWYVLPFLAIGTSIAVITAFLLDPDNAEGEAA
jgi:hypothetical protein